MRPSPILAEYQRWPMDSSASNKASPATAAPIASTTPRFRGRMPLSIRLRSSRGTATVMPASSATMIRNKTSSRRYGLAYEAMRRTVPGLSFCWVIFRSLENECMVCQLA